MKSLTANLKSAVLKISFLDDAQKNQVRQALSTYDRELIDYQLELIQKFPQLVNLSSKQKAYIFKEMNQDVKDGWEPILNRMDALRQQEKHYPKKLQELILLARNV